MPRFSNRTLEAVRQVEAELGTLREGGASGLRLLPGALREMFAVDLAVAFALRPHGSGLAFDGAFEAGSMEPILPRVANYIADKQVGWTGYNPMRPQPKQRNVVLSSEQIAAQAGLRHISEVPIFRDLYQTAGLDVVDTRRVLVCQGSSLLAWLGVFRASPFTPTETRVLKRLVPPLLHRLEIERLLSQGSTLRALFDAAFVAIAAPAFVTRADGILVEANSAGALWIERTGRRRGAQELQDGVKRGRDSRFSVTPVRVVGAAPLRLVVLRQWGQPDLSAVVAAAAARWSCTPRQIQVLTLLTEGLTNRVIAAEMAVSESAIEQHLTALFEKAQVETRSELIAAIWKENR